MSLDSYLGGKVNYVLEINTLRYFLQTILAVVRGEALGVQMTPRRPAG